MKKHIGLYLLLIPLLANAQINDSLKVSQTDISVSKQDGYDKIAYGNCYIQESGKPELPVISKSFVIPSDAIVTGLVIKATNRRKIAGTYLVYPVQPPAIIRREEKPAFIQPDSVYLSYSDFPHKPAIISSDHIVQGYYVVTISSVLH